MDSHYEQVQRARAAASSTAPRLYFAYSTILDRTAFDEWRLQHSYTDFSLPAGRVAQALEVELVFDFQSRWWGGRVAGLADKPGASVWGLLLEIPGVDWPIIQHKEGAVTQMCIERQVRVRLRDTGEELSATAFTTNPARATLAGAVSTRFLDALASGARSAGLPADYLARLRDLKG